MNEKRTNLEVIAPTVEEAIARGLADLGLPEEAVDIEILDTGTRGLFGLGTRQARVRLSIKLAARAKSSGMPVQPKIDYETAPVKDIESKQKAVEIGHGRVESKKEEHIEAATIIAADDAQPTELDDDSQAALLEAGVGFLAEGRAAWCKTKSTPLVTSLTSWESLTSPFIISTLSPASCKFRFLPVEKLSNTLTTCFFLTSSETR